MINFTKKIYRALPIPIKARKIISKIVYKANYLTRKWAKESQKRAVYQFPQKQGSEKDFIFFGVIDWEFRYQRPQHLASNCATDSSRVFYIESTRNLKGHKGYSVKSVHKNVYIISINTNSLESIYVSPPKDDVYAYEMYGLGALLLDANIGDAVSVVHHPYWYKHAYFVPKSLLIYDCMDHHKGFDSENYKFIEAEERLMTLSDACIATSIAISNNISKHSKNIHIVRNGVEFEYFNSSPTSIYSDGISAKKVIGYIGAIAEWFDLDLLKKIASRCSDCEILLIGADTINASWHLKDYKNVRFLGEIPYSKLTQFMYAFDVCIIPFKLNSLTAATNPVKVYEYLAAGKSVISTNLPEVVLLGEYVHVAESHHEFIEKIKKQIDGKDNASKASIEFAKKQDWRLRARQFTEIVKNTRQKNYYISVVVVTYNNLALTKACLNSIFANQAGCEYELIIVDNHSSDDTCKYLDEIQTKHSNIVVIKNMENYGFSKANNIGMKIAQGDYIVLLNNDTQVTQDWLIKLVKHLHFNPKIGIVGPVTNNIGNEAKIEIDYTSIPEMEIISNEYCKLHCGVSINIKTLAFFAVMFSRDVYNKIGGLDEIYGLGFFEDDDYCRRAEIAGFDLILAEDVFIHHELSASFSKINNTDRKNLFERNRAIYERRYGKWMPHGHRK